MVRLLLVSKKSNKWLWPSEEVDEDPIDLCNRSLFATTPTADRFMLDGWWMPIHTDCITLCKR